MDIVIVGAGCFGLSTAYHLLLRGYKRVTVLDRSDQLPAPDAASRDLNKVVRSSYADSFYTRFANEAIQTWKDRSQWKDTYHESGILVLGTKDGYADASFQNDAALGLRLSPLNSEQDVRSKFPPGVKTGSFFNEHSTGYLNSDGGWANATQGVDLLLSKVMELGGQVKSGKGKTVVQLLRNEGGRTVGVQCTDGTRHDADLVILAIGAWTASCFPELNLDQKCVATGQTIATIQLTPGEAEVYKACPILLDFGPDGFYIFPPNEDNVVKLALHSAGYTHADSHGISTPRTILSHGNVALSIPKEAAITLRENLRKVYPDLAHKEFSSTRVCWYHDSPDGDWYIGRVPSDLGLMIACGDSGHGYKFLPVLGRLVVDIMEGKASSGVASKFAVDRTTNHLDESRGSLHRKELDAMELCSPDDLLGNADL